MKSAQAVSEESLVKSEDPKGTPDNSIFLPSKEIPEMAQKAKERLKGKNLNIFKISNEYVEIGGQGMYLRDISVFNKKIEDDIYSSNPIYLFNVRRGFTYITTSSNLNYSQQPLNTRNEHQIAKSGGKYKKVEKEKEKDINREEQKKEEMGQIMIARKGLIKFFDIDPESLIIDENKVYKSPQDYIINPVLKVFREKEEIEIFCTRKANGENAQISYIRAYNGWICGSKNVGVIIQEMNDLRKYKGPRYTYAIKIGEVWLKIIEDMDKERLDELKRDMSGRTFVGEFVGNPNYQHLIRYNRVSIHFYAIVDNESIHTCLDPKYSQSIFHKYALDSVHFQSLGIFKEKESCFKAILNAYITVGRSSIYDGEEGAVLYFVKRSQGSQGPHGPQTPHTPQTPHAPHAPHISHDITLVLCKLKTLDYRIYRKLREKLKNLCSFGGDEREVLRRFISDYKALVNDTLQRASRIMGHPTTGFDILPNGLHYYNRVAELAIQNVLDRKVNYNQISYQYVDFLYSIMDEVNNEYINWFIKDRGAKKSVILITPPYYLEDECIKALSEIGEYLTFEDIGRCEKGEGKVPGILNIHFVPKLGEKDNGIDWEAIGGSILAGYSTKVGEEDIAITEWLQLVHGKKDNGKKELRCVSNMEESQLRMLHSKHTRYLSEFMAYQKATLSNFLDCNKMVNKNHQRPKPASICVQIFKNVKQLFPSPAQQLSSSTPNSYKK